MCDEMQIVENSRIQLLISFKILYNPFVCIRGAS